MLKKISLVSIFCGILSAVSCDRGQEFESFTADVDAELSEVIPFDVTILYPLANDTNRPFILRPNSVSHVDGKPIMSNIERFLGREADLTYVFGVRLDPCFPGLVANVSDCKPQIRLSMQSTTFDGMRAEDKSFHVFYDLKMAELKEAVLEIISLRKALGINISDSLPLQIHPGLQGQILILQKDY